MATEHEGDTGPASAGASPATLLVFAGILAAVVVVFGVLPRWAAPPVVTTGTGVPEASEASPVAASPAAPVSPPAPPMAHGVTPTIAAASAPAPPADDFEAAVTEGLAALDRGAPEEARTAFARAEALRPGTTVVEDGLARADSALRANLLEAHRKRAEAAEADEDWPTALREYDQALKLEPAVRFAVLGSARASLRAELADRLDAYLKRPDRLSTEAVAHEAEIALDRASEIAPAGPRLLRQIAELRARLAEARTPVPVRLLSDDRTEVTILRVGPQGRFREKSVALRPGSYVVVGTRRGYRDTRQTLVVPAGRSPEPLVVRCQEAL